MPTTQTEPTEVLPLVRLTPSLVVSPKAVVAIYHVAVRGGWRAWVRLTGGDEDVFELGQFESEDEADSAVDIARCKIEEAKPTP